MELMTFFLALICAVVAFFAFRRAGWFASVRSEKTINSIWDAKRHNILERASTSMYIKTVSFHHTYWTSDEVVDSLLKSHYPVEIIIGPYLCRESHKLLAYLQMKDNIKLYMLPFEKRETPDAMLEFYVIDGADYHYEAPTSDPFEDAKSKPERLAKEVHEAYGDSTMLKYKFDALRRQCMLVEGDPLHFMLEKMRIIYVDKHGKNRLVDTEERYQKLLKDYKSFKTSQQFQRKLENFGLIGD